MVAGLPQWHRQWRVPHLGPLAPNECFYLSVCLASLMAFLHDFSQGALLDKESGRFQGSVALRKINLPRVRVSRFPVVSSSGSC